jgi:RimJ/RimL family protein N-acetyltransferase
VGHGELDRIDADAASARVSRVLVAPEIRGKGVGTSIVKEILRKGFEQIHLHRIELQVWEINTAAVTCYINAGFTTEGLLRDARKMNGKYYNVYLMSILEDEWRR